VTETDAVQTGIFALGGVAVGGLVTWLVEVSRRRHDARTRLRTRSISTTRFPIVVRCTQVTTWHQLIAAHLRGFLIRHRQTVEAPMATVAWSETPPDADEVHPVGAGADGSFCHRPNSFPWGSLQVANQPMFGTGAGSFASPPSSRTRAAPALMSSTSK
jgi:hypothetical protein